MEKLRHLIVSVVGHVDHGKSSILDRIRQSCIVDTELGRITQAIGASVVPSERIRELCASLLKDKQLKVPGLLFIDTPGHAAFTSLRKRGGSLADMAILVVDINEGFKPQTHEALQILKQFKTPFVVAANKVDIIQGWKADSKCGIFTGQSKELLSELDKKIYELVASLFEHGFEADRFDRVTDFTKQVAIVPVSAKTGQGIAEMLLVLIGMAQKFLAARLKKTEDEFARGTILEVKEIPGLGTALDVILYSGRLCKQDTLLIGCPNAIIETKVKALFEPEPLCEVRDKKASFRSVNCVESAAAVRLAAPNTEGVVAGMPIIGLKPGRETTSAKNDIEKQIQEVLLNVDSVGIVIKADSLGSIEALLKMLKEKGVKVKSANIGNITKRDITEAESNIKTEPLNAVILGFNVRLTKDAELLLAKCPVKIITNDIIYKLIEDYEAWVEAETRKLQEQELGKLIQPCKFMVLPGYVFRQSNPAIFGVEVLAGVLHTNTPVMNKDGKLISTVKSIQDQQENIELAERGKRVAVSMFNVTIGRQIKEGELLYSAVPEEHFKEFKRLKHLLNEEQKQILKEIAEIMRKKDSFWGV